GTYTLVAISQTGCVDSADVTVYSSATATPSICMVTCDSNSTNNLIIWDKSSFTDVDSVIIYREVSSSVYTRIGAVSNDSLSLFEDTDRSIGPANGDPNIASYRYKIQIRDSFGSYGPLSPYHTTIYITDDGAGLFSWSIPYLIEGAVNPVNNYILMCDTANVNVWTSVQVVGSVASSAIDLGYIYHPFNASWRVETAWSISCDPTRATINTSRSNIKNGTITTGLTAENILNNIILYPNPATDLLTLSMYKGVYGSISIVNILGETVYTTFLEEQKQITSIQIDVSQFDKGFYNLVIHSKDHHLNSTFIVN
ncbi:MAG TPA: T9SS type A sorting domain-containing protein, partial [Bacteroidia bacterium]